MSYNFQFGDEVDKKIEQSKQDFTKVIFPFKSGTTVKVRVPASRPRMLLDMHGGWNVFKSSPCKPDELYCKAAAWYKAEANKAKGNGDNDLYDELFAKHKLVRSKSRVFVGFINLETGTPIVIEVSPNQYESISDTLNKYNKKLNKYAFLLTKQGSGKGTTVSISMLLDDEDDPDLTTVERENFENSADMEIGKEVFANCLIVHDEETQRKNLTGFGFDLKNLEGNDDEYEF